MKILHVAVHLGGGVGTVLKNWIKKDINNDHTILVLNETYYGDKQHNIIEQLRGKYEIINEYIKENDILIIHFWNHPLLYEFLVNNPFPPCRMCIWSHVSGLYPPYTLTDKLIEISDIFVLSSPISYPKIDKRHHNKTNVIWTTGGVEQYTGIKISSSEKFTIGYIGTLDFSKLHPHFVDICEKIINRIPNVNFVVCGNGSDRAIIESDISNRGLSDYFDFKGFVTNISEIIPTLDMFGYPLNHTHFGTCEQVFGETMAFGVIPIVMDNPSEMYIVGEFGIVANSIDDYVDKVVSYYHNPVDNSSYLKHRAEELYSIDKMINSWNDIFINQINTERTIKKWNIADNTGISVFSESIGYSKEEFLQIPNENLRELFGSNLQWKSPSKGSVYQYNSAFPNDTILKKLIELCE